MKPTIAVILPCYNEAIPIAQVIQDFKKQLPDCTVYVYDNNSTDATIANAINAGAVVVRETRQGKGYVVRRAFADVDADIYVMADGDGTYDASAVQQMINVLCTEQLDMVVGSRQDSEQDNLYRKGHRLGNWLLTNTIGFLFGFRFNDVLSGYRVFSKRFVKSFPSIATGFEIEAMLTVHALELDLPCQEVPTQYFQRLEGSESKLSTYKDGFRILRTILDLFRKIKPLYFYGYLAILIAGLSMLIMLPIWVDFLHTGQVSRFPSAFLSIALMICALISLICGLIMEHASTNHWELKYLNYLNYPAISPKNALTFNSTDKK
ncbi:MAG: glycosyltransferase [Methylococcales bacterium]|nr:glycosyltransferase [Methylococcales bacterium]